MYHISEQGFRCIISMSRGSDVSYQWAGVQMYHISEQGFRCIISISRGSDVSYQ